MGYITGSGLWDHLKNLYQLASSESNKWGENASLGEEMGQKNQQNPFLFRFIKGFINRHRPVCPDNEEFVVFVRKKYILNLRYYIPTNVLDRNWLVPPGILENVRAPLGLVLQMTRALMELHYSVSLCCLPWLERPAFAKHFFGRVLHKKSQYSYWKYKAMGGLFTEYF